MVNWAPVLTLWAAVVAVVLGFEHDEALTLGRAVAGLNIYEEPYEEARKNRDVGSKTTFGGEMTFAAGIGGQACNIAGLTPNLTPNPSSQCLRRPGHK